MICYMYTNSQIDRNIYDIIVGFGEVTEWSNVTVLKTVVRVSVPWVRIPPSPPGNAIYDNIGHARNF